MRILDIFVYHSMIVAAITMGFFYFGLLPSLLKEEVYIIPALIIIIAVVIKLIEREVIQE